MVEIRPTASDIHLGGNNVSIGMLSTWWRCPRLFYWQYLHPRENSESRGVEPRYTKDYLLIGSAVHTGLAAWYMSGWGNGDYQLDAGLEAIRASLSLRVDESPSEEEHSAVVAESLRLMTNYAKEYGPAAKSPEFPTFRVATDELGPMIERTFAVTLRTGHQLTVRPDMVGYNFDSLVAVEHKCPAAQSVTRTIGEARLGGQGLAQEAILGQLGLDTAGQLINIIVRGRVAKTRPFQREVIAHDPWAVSQLLQLAGDTVQAIQATTEKWEQLVDDGFSPIDAARAAFPMVGTLSGHCVGKFGPCTAFYLCSASGRELSMLQGFKPRTYHADLPATE